MKTSLSRNRFSKSHDIGYGARRLRQGSDWGRDRRWGGSMLIPMLSLRVCGGGGGGGLLQHCCRCRGGGMNVQWQLHRCPGAIGRGHSQRTAGAGHSATRCGHWTLAPQGCPTFKFLPRLRPGLGSRTSAGIPSSTLLSGHHQHTNNTPITRYIFICYRVPRVLPPRAGPARSQCHGALGNSSANAAHQCIYHRIQAISHTAYTSLNLSLSAQNPAPAA